MNKKHVFWLLGMIVVVLAIGFVMLKNEQVSEHVVKIGYLSHTSGAPWLIADSKGLFAAQNIKTEGVRFESSNQLYDALARGDVDITPGTSILPIMVNHIIDPSKVKIFSVVAITMADPFDLVIVNSDSDIRSVQDLAGKKIGLFPGSTATLFLTEYLKRAGVTVDNIEFVQLPPQNQLQALTAGSVDALYSYEPEITRAVVEHDKRVLAGPVYASFVDGAALGVAAVSQKFVTENPELAQETVEVFDQVFNFMNTNISETRSLLAKSYNLSEPVAERMAIDIFPKPYNIDKQRVQEFVNVLVRLGDLESVPDLSTVYYR